ncbi:MAG: MoxR family ATPase [Planctomycetota bacterium]
MDADFEKQLTQFQEHYAKINDEMHKAIIGQKEVLKQILASIFSRGHCLLVGVPGLAKTSMVSSLAQIMNLKFKRIQFTPDLMPSDITGTNVIDENQQGQRNFRFIPGPVFANILLADEINRTPPKTQAALLEAMQERQVSIGQTTYDLPVPFFVIATQNPIEQEGTYPLPEAQLDRFMFNIHVDYPSVQEEENILTLTTKGERLPLKKLIQSEDILMAQRVIDKIIVSNYIVSYVTKLVRATRPKAIEAPEFVRELVDWGAGPRAGQYLLLGGKSLAAMAGRVNVSIQDIKDVAIPVLRHRIATNFQAQSEGIDSVGLIQKLLKTIPEPEIPKYV